MNMTCSEKISERTFEMVLINTMTGGILTQHTAST